MCVGIAASCLTSIALSLGCAACGAVGGVVSKATRFSYALMLLFATFLAVAMLSDMMKDWILESFTDAWSLPTPADCEGLDCYTPAAIQARAQNAAVNATMQQAHDQLEAKLGRLAGALAVNRVMLGVAVFHGALAVILFGVANSNDPRSKLQNGAWGLKLALYFGLIGAMFFPGADSFTGVPSLFRVGGFIFILVQLTMLIDSSYMTFSSLLDMGSKQEEAGSFPFWNWVILLITLCGYGFMLFVCVVTIAKNNREDDGCAEGVWAVCLVFLFTIVTSVLSISPFVRDASNGAGSENGVFQSGMVAAYASYQVLSALINHPEERCHLMDIHDGSTPIKMLGLFFTFVAVLWSAVRSGSHTDAGAYLPPPSSTASEKCLTCASTSPFPSGNPPPPPRDWCGYFFVSPLVRPRLTYFPCRLQEAHCRSRARTQPTSPMRSTRGARPPATTSRRWCSTTTRSSTRSSRWPRCTSRCCSQDGASSMVRTKTDQLAFDSTC